MMQPKKKDPKKYPNKPGNQAKGFLKYTDMAVKMLVIILVGVFGGVKLDEWMQLETPIFTLILSLGSTALAMYVIIKGVTKND